MFKFRSLSIIAFITFLPFAQLFCQTETEILTGRIVELETYIKTLESEFPNVLKTVDTSGNVDITLYRPFGLQIELTYKRPEKADSIFFCIPAAYTTRDTTIDGYYVAKGIVISTEPNKKLTGACIIDGNKILIIKKEEIDNQIINDVISGNKSFFQQSILVRNSTLIPCLLFKEKKNVRRALVHFENYDCVAESILPVTIKEFQESLIQIGAIDAIYLDMGTWSEGWYKDQNCNFQRIGEKFNNTHLQTNWLIFNKS